MTDVVTRFTIDASGATAGAARITEAIALIEKGLTAVDASAKKAQATLSTSFSGNTGVAALATEVSRLAGVMAGLRTPPGMATFSAELQRVATSATEAATAMGRLEASSARAISNQMAANVAQAEGSFAGMNATMGKSNELLKTMAYLVSAIAFKDLSSGIYDASMAFTRFEVKLGASFKNTKELNDEMELVKRTALTLGTNLGATMDGFTRFATSAKLSGASTKEINDIFVNMSEAMTVFQSSTEETKGVWLALEQVFNKGSVQMQEIKLQLGNDLPGAFEMMAKSMNVSAQELGKLMAAGKVSAEALKGFAREYRDAIAGQLPAATQTALAAVNRLQGGWQIFLNEVGKSGVMKGLADTLNSVFKSMIDMSDGTVRLTPRFQQLAEQVAEAFNKILSAAKTVATFVVDHFKEIATVLEVAFGAKMLQMASRFFGSIISAGIPALVGLARATGVGETAAAGLARAIGPGTGLLGMFGQLILVIPRVAVALGVLVAANPILAAIVLAVGAVGTAWAVMATKQKQATDQSKHSITTYSQSVIGDVKQITQVIQGQVKVIETVMTQADREYLASLQGRTVAQTDELRQQFAKEKGMYDDYMQYRQSAIENGMTRELLITKQGGKDKVDAEAASQAEEEALAEVWAKKIEGIFSSVNSFLDTLWNNMWKGLLNIAKSAVDNIIGMIGKAFEALKNLIGMGKGAGKSSGGGDVEGRATGGPVNAGHPYMVGEHGPEMVIPKHDATVIPAGMTGKLLSGGMRGYASGGIIPGGRAGIVGEQGPELMYANINGPSSQTAHVMQPEDVAKFARTMNTTPTFKPSPNGDPSIAGFDGKPSVATLHAAMARFTETMDSAVQNSTLSKKGESFAEMILGLSVADWDKYLTKGPSKDATNGISPYFNDVHAAVDTYPWVEDYIAGAFGQPFANDALHSRSTGLAAQGRDSLIDVRAQQAAYKKAYDDYVKANLVPYTEFAYNFAAGESGMAGLYISNKDIVPFDTLPFESFSDFTKGKYSNTMQPDVGNMFYFGFGDNVGTTYAKIADGGATGGKTTNWSEGGFNVSNVDASGGFDSKSIEENNAAAYARQQALSNQALGIDNDNYIDDQGFNLQGQQVVQPRTFPELAGVIPNSTQDFWRGGSAEVGGVGGADSQLVQFRATPGELINVTRPQDEEQEERMSRHRSGPSVSVVFNISTPDANSFRRSQKQIMQKLDSQIRQSMKIR